MAAIPKEILKKVRQIEIQTRRLVNDLLAGEYHSTFKGMGMEFSEVREYVPGDDIRSIDWNVTARMNKPFVKQFVEERELTVILLVDISASGQYSSQRQTKNEIAAELSALLALSAIHNNDKVGLILFTDRIEKFIAPKKGKTHVLRVIREVLSFDPEGRETKLDVGLDYLNKAVRRKAVVFLISDFINEGYEKLMRVVARRHDLICINLMDQRESELPNLGLLNLLDAETGDELLVDTADSKVRQALSILAARESRAREDFFKNCGIDRVQIRTDQSYAQPIINFFRSRD